MCFQSYFMSSACLKVLLFFVCLAGELTELFGRCAECEGAQKQSKVYIDISLAMGVKAYAKV